MAGTKSANYFLSFAAENQAVIFIESFTVYSKARCNSFYFQYNLYYWCISCLILIKMFKALNGLLCADVQLRNYPLISHLHSVIIWF